jgi:hypothetical protein
MKGIIFKISYIRVEIKKKKNETNKRWKKKLNLLITYFFYRLIFEIFL